MVLPTWLINERSWELPEYLAWARLVLPAEVPRRRIDNAKGLDTVSDGLLITCWRLNSLLFIERASLDMDWSNCWSNSIGVMNASWADCTDADSVLRSEAMDVSQAKSCSSLKHMDFLRFDDSGVEVCNLFLLSVSSSIPKFSTFVPLATLLESCSTTISKNSSSCPKQSSNAVRPCSSNASMPCHNSVEIWMFFDAVIFGRLLEFCGYCWKTRKQVCISSERT